MSALLVGGCASKPSTLSNIPKKTPKTGTEFGQWRGQGSASRQVVKDGVKKIENWSVNLEVVSRTPGFGRIEVTGAMGVYGGTIAWKEKETRILLPGQRKFVIAPNSENAFVEILPFAISPSEVEAILFDRDFNSEALARRNVTCRRESGSEKEMCSSPAGFSIERTRGFEETIFKVMAPDGSNVKMRLKQVQAKVEERPELWELEAPRGFRVVHQSRL